MLWLMTKSIVRKINSDDKLHQTNEEDLKNFIVCCINNVFCSVSDVYLKPTLVSSDPSLTAKLPEPTTVSPSVTPAEYKPDSPIFAARIPTLSPPSDPERAEIQARTPEPVTYSLTEGPHTASPEQPGDPHTETDPTTVSVTPTRMLDYDVQDLNDSHKVESVPVRGDALVPMQLPPLPTTRSQPPRLDISHGEEEGGQTGSGQGSNHGSSDGSGVRAVVTPMQVLLPESTAASEQEVKTTSRPSDLHGLSSDRVTTGPGLGIEAVNPEVHTPEGGLPALAGEVGQQPAVVFKEDVTPGTTLTFDLDQSAVAPVDGESAKPPFHLIIVNVHDQNQSGE